MKIKIRKLHPEATIPEYKTQGAAGFDLVSLEDAEILPGESKAVRTGIAVEIPEGFEIQVRPRSGVSLKTSLRVANSPGTVDSDFRGEICVIMHNSNGLLKNSDGTTLELNGSHKISKGERIAQGVVCPVIRAIFEESDDLSDTERGTNGFGSTGLK